MNEKTLLPWQMEGVEFLLSKPAALNYNPHHYLNDDMGLGKTPTTCVAMKLLKPRHALYIVLASLRDHWAIALQEWGGAKAEDIFVIRTGADKIPNSAKHIIVSYQLTDVDNIFDQLIAIDYGAVICDEAQALQSLDSNRSHNILGKTGHGLMSKGYYKIFLSGTAATDRIIQLYPILKTAAPQCIKPYTSTEGFGTYFCDGFYVRGEGWNFKGASHVEELRKRVMPFMLRRTIEQVMPDLPPYIFEDVFVQVEMTANVHNTNKATLRKLTGIAKVPKVIEFIREKKQSCDKIVVFAYHREVIALLVEQLSGFGALPITGSQNESQKREACQKFTTPHCDILVIQLTAGGAGVDGLQKECNYVVQAETDWTPGKTGQAWARVRRMLQTKITYVSRIKAKGTIDDLVDGSHNKKDRVLKQLFKPMEYRMLEKVLEEGVAYLARIAVAMEQSLVLQGGPAPKTEAKKVVDKSEDVKETKTPAKPAKTAAVKEAPSAEGPTRDDASTALRATLDVLAKTPLGKDGAKQACIDVVKTIGKADKLAEVPMANLAAVIAGFQALVTGDDSGNEEDGI